MTGRTQLQTSDVYQYVLSQTREHPVLAELRAATMKVPQNVMQTRRVPLGVYRGLRFGMVLHPQYRPEIYLEGQITRQDMLSREHQGPRAVLNALERVAGNLD